MTLREPQGERLLDATFDEEVLIGRTIIATVADEYGISVEEMTGKVRKPYFVEARRAAARRMVEGAGLSQKMAGHLLGGREHSTIIHLLRGLSA